jgi:hypothetical protein
VLVWEPANQLADQPAVLKSASSTKNICLLESCVFPEAEWETYRYKKSSLINPQLIRPKNSFPGFKNVIGTLIKLAIDTRRRLNYFMLRIIILCVKKLLAGKVIAGAL